MKEFKNFLFYFLVFYVAIFLGLYIKQTITVRDTLYRPVGGSPGEKYETFITESRAKLSNYKALATTDEQISCLNEVEKAINISYKNHHLNISNYKEALIYYWEAQNTESNDKVLDFNNNVNNVINTCKPKEKGKDVTGILSNVYANTILAADSFYEVLFLYVHTINIKSFSTRVI